MAKLMRSTQAYWAGNKFVPAGTVLPEGHGDVVPEFYEEFEVAEPATGKSLGKAQTPTSKVSEKK